MVAINTGANEELTSSTSNISMTAASSSLLQHLVSLTKGRIPNFSATFLVGDHNKLADTNNLSDAMPFLRDTDSRIGHSSLSMASS